MAGLADTFPESLPAFHRMFPDDQSRSAVNAIGQSTISVRRLERAYASAIRAEEQAATERQAWRLATVSESCLRRLQAARDGRPLPEPRMLPTPRNRARQGLAALASLGVSIGRAITRAASLQKARTVRAARRIACVARRSARRAVLAVASRAMHHHNTRRACPGQDSAMNFDEALNSMLVHARREIRSYFGQDLWEADINWDRGAMFNGDTPSLRDADISHAIGFISGVAAAMDMTPLELLDLVVEPTSTTRTTSNQRRGRSRRAS